MRICRALAGLLALLLLAVMVGPPASPVQAQESGTKEVQVRAGPYDINVVASLSNLSLGQARFFITVLDITNGEPVNDARVVVRLKHSVNDTQGWATALYVPDLPEHYEARVSLDAPGIWRVAVEVTSSRGSEEIAAPTLEVPAMRSYTAGSIVFAGVFVLLLLGAGYVIWSVRRLQRQRLGARGTSDGDPGNAGLDT